MKLKWETLVYDFRVDVVERALKKRGGSAGFSRAEIKDLLEGGQSLESAYVKIAREYGVPEQGRSGRDTGFFGRIWRLWKGFLGRRRW